jgi:hypothetical protein
MMQNFGEIKKSYKCAGFTNRGYGDLRNQGSMRWVNDYELPMF